MSIAYPIAVQEPRREPIPVERDFSKRPLESMGLQAAPPKPETLPFPKSNPREDPPAEFTFGNSPDAPVEKTECSNV
jgi:hypothetical protein